MSKPSPLTLKELREVPHFVNSLTNCARCGSDHHEMAFLRFGRPSGDYTHWGLCPRTAEPVLVMFAEVVP